MEKLGIIGVGKLGLCFALSLEKVGYQVIGLDLSNDYVKSLNEKTFATTEPKVTEYLKNSKNFVATTSIQDLKECNTIFVLVATPSDKQGRYDTTQIDTALDSLISLERQSATKHLVICCTVMPGTTEKYQNSLSEFNWDVSYNPEFIAQGTVIENQENPDMVLIGQANLVRGFQLEEIYRKLCKNKPVFAKMKPISAEITKIGLNSFLTTKIAFANMIGDLATKVGAEPLKILNAIGSDSRIGHKFLGYGYGYGGPCLPRDNRALEKFASGIEMKINLPLVVDQENSDHLERQLEIFKQKHSKHLPIIFEYVAYKPNTTILEESQKLKLAFRLAADGYKIIIKDRQEVIDQLKSSEYKNWFTFEKIEE